MSEQLHDAIARARGNCRACGCEVVIARQPDGSWTVLELAAEAGSCRPVLRAGGTLAVVADRTGEFRPHTCRPRRRRRR